MHKRAMNWLPVATQTVSVLAAACAAYFAYRTVAENSNARRISSFLALYQKLMDFEQEYVTHSHELETKPRFAQQLLNHLEVIAALYFRDEINRGLVDEVMKEYFIGQVTVLRPTILKARGVEPSAYSHIVRLIREWDFPNKARDFGSLLA